MMLLWTAVDGIATEGKHPMIFNQRESPNSQNWRSIFFESDIPLHNFLIASSGLSGWPDLH